MYEQFACIYICVLCVCLGPTEARRVSMLSPLELELQPGVSHHVSADLYLGPLQEQPDLLTAELSPAFRQLNSNQD